jgi:hypothetical protein
MNIMHPFFSFFSFVWKPFCASKIKNERVFKKLLQIGIIGKKEYGGEEIVNFKIFKWIILIFLFSSEITIFVHEIQQHLLKKNCFASKEGLKSSPTNTHKTLP